MDQEEKRKLYNKIQKQLEPFEQERIKHLWEIGILECILFIIFLILSYFSYKTFDDYTEISILLGTLGLGILIIMYAIQNYINKTFKDKLKYNCKNILESTLNIKFLIHETFDYEKLQKSNLFSKFNETEADDIYKATYKDVEYRVQETKLIYKTDSSRGMNFSINQFIGLVIVFKFNKHISNKTIIAPKHDSMIMNNKDMKPLIICLILMIIIYGYIILDAHKPTTEWYLSEFLPLLLSPGTLTILGLIIYLSIVAYKKFKIMRNTVLEDIDFNNEYKVHTENEVEARYLITTSFITRFIALQKVFHTKEIKCSFFDNEVMFAIETNKDMFELGSMYHPLINNNQYIENCIDQITAIQNFIDLFKLNEKTGL